jgi:hypothetical protein
VHAPEGSRARDAEVLKSSEIEGVKLDAARVRRLGIRLERIAPGHPEQNGRHERMHLTLKTEATL